MADCGELVSEVPEEEPEFNPDDVVVGQCGQDFPVRGAPGETRDVRVIATNTNDVTAIVDIVVRAEGSGEIGRVSNVSIASLSNETTTVTITIPPEGRYSVRADIEDVTQGTGRAPVSSGIQRTPTDERVHAGSPGESNGKHRPVSDGGTTVGARAALAGACGGCAERSRKLTAANRRLRETFRGFWRAT